MTDNIKIVPAILTDDPEALTKMVRQAESFCDYVQFDIMDGLFVPSQSITHADIARLTTNLSWEAHLMVEHPEGYLADFKQAGASRIVFHYEAAPSPRDIIYQARELGLGVGLAINPETPVSKFLPLTGEIDSVLFLTVNPGFYGSPFIPEVLDKVMELNGIAPDLEIGVDGGIKESNIARVAGSSVSVICVGSGIFLNPDPGAGYRRLKTLAESGLKDKEP